MLVVDSTLYILATGSYGGYLLLSFNAETGEFINIARDVPLVGYGANLATDGEYVYVESDGVVFTFLQNLTLANTVLLETEFSTYGLEDFAVLPNYLVLGVGLLKDSVEREAVILYDREGRLVKVNEYNFSGYSRTLKVVGDTIFFAAVNSTHALIVALSSSGEELWSTIISPSLESVRSYSLAAGSADLYVLASNGTNIWIARYTTDGQLVTEKIFNISLEYIYSSLGGNYLYVSGDRSGSVLALSSDLSSMSTVNISGFATSLVAGDGYALVGGLAPNGYYYYIAKILPDGTLVYEVSDVLDEGGFDSLAGTALLDGNFYVFYSSEPLLTYNMTSWMYVTSEDGQDVLKTGLGRLEQVLDADSSGEKIYILLVNISTNEYTLREVSGNVHYDISLPASWDNPAVKIATSEDAVYVALSDGKILKYQNHSLVWSTYVTYEYPLSIIDLVADETGVYILCDVEDTEKPKFVLIKIAPDSIQEWRVPIEFEAFSISVGDVIAVLGMDEESFGYRLLLVSKSGDVILDKLQSLEFPLAVAVNGSEVIVASVRYSSAIGGGYALGKLILSVYNTNGSLVLSAEKNISWSPYLILFGPPLPLTNKIIVSGDSIYLALNVYRISFDILIVRATRTAATSQEKAPPPAPTPVPITSIVLVAIATALVTVVIYVVVKRLRR